MGASLRSMTGYGSSSDTVEGWRLRVECKSVNHRGLQIRCFTPDALRWMEPEINDAIRRSIKRGRVEVQVELEEAKSGEGADFRKIDEHRFGEVARELKRLAVEFRLETPISLESMWEYREFFERSRADVFSEESLHILMPIFEEALDEMVASRHREGQGIAADLGDYLDRMAAGLDEVEKLRSEGQQQLRIRAESRLRQALSEFEIKEIDEGRLTQEIAYYVEKGDIDEELQRARSHVEKLQTVIDEAREEAVGKKVDFYLQELVRETNTMGSKSQHAGLTDLVIEMKSLVEKMREQAANVE